MAVRCEKLDDATDLLARDAARLASPHPKSEAINQWYLVKSRIYALLMIS